MRNSQIGDRTLKGATGAVRAEPISGAEGRGRLSVEPRGLQRLAVEGAQVQSGGAGWPGCPGNGSETCPSAE